MMRLYTHPISGHGHRVELMLALLSLPHEVIEVDLLAREQKGEAFTRLNPWGQVPVLVDGEVTLEDSSAIVVYLTRKYAERDTWLPEDPVEAARVQQWLSRASGELVRGPAMARRARILPGANIDLATAQADATALLGRMDTHLEDREWLAAERPTLADVAMYSYTRVADEGGVDLAPFAHVGAWLARVEGLPGFRPMPRRPRTE